MVSGRERENKQEGYSQCTPIFGYKACDWLQCAYDGMLHVKVDTHLALASPSALLLMSSLILERLALARHMENVYIEIYHGSWTCDKIWIHCVNL